MLKSELYKYFSEFYVIHIDILFQFRKAAFTKKLFGPATWIHVSQFDVDFWI